MVFSFPGLCIHSRQVRCQRVVFRISPPPHVLFSFFLFFFFCRLIEAISPLPMSFFSPFSLYIFLSSNWGFDCFPSLLVVSCLSCVSCLCYLRGFFAGLFSPAALCLKREPVASDASCWNELLKDYECGICFDVLVGVHVLGEQKETSRTCRFTVMISQVSLSFGTPSASSSTSLDLWRSVSVACGGC